MVNASATKQKKGYSVPFEYEGEIIKIIDGDTVDVRIDIGFSLTTIQRLRLNRINCCEMKSKNPKEKAKAIKAKNLLCKLILNKTLKVKTFKTDAFGRYLAEVYFSNENGQETNLSDHLLAIGLATIYKK